MKIGFVVLGGVDRGGEYRVTPWLLWLLERLTRQHEVHVFALRQEPQPCRYDLLGAHILNIGSRPRRVRALAQIVAEHRRSPFEVFHAISAAPMGVIAGAAGRLLGVPVVLHITGGELVSLPDIGYGGRTNWRGRLWLRIAAAAAARVIAPSKTTQQKARELGIVAEYLPFGVALDRWPARAPRERPAKDNSEPRRAYQAHDSRAPDPRSPDRLIHVASLNRVKDQKTLLRSARRMLAAGASFHLDIAGEDTLGGEIQRFADEQGLGDVVTFHGFLTHAKLCPLVDQAHVLLVSSRHETGLIAALEAAVAGVPTVGTAVGQLPEWAPEAALTVPVGDDEALAKATIGLLMDETRRLAIAKRAHDRAVRENADWTAQRMLALYEELVGRSGGGGEAGGPPIPGSGGGTTGGPTRRG